MNRRNFISSAVVGSLFFDQLVKAGVTQATESDNKEPFFTRRCFTIWIEDLLNWDWVQRAYDAGINTIATHHDPDEIVSFINSDKGQKFMNDCEQLGIEVEHSLHAYSSILPRHLFKTDPKLFRMNEKGERSSDSNFCVSNNNTLRIIAENAVKYAELLPSTSGRYFYTYDDAKHLCKCPDCSQLSASEQTLIAENTIVTALRKHINPEALVSHAAYVYTMGAPKQVKPEPGVFLEWAPITRTHERPITDRDAFNDKLSKKGEHGRLLDSLYENLKVFENKNAQVFEYWFDSYRASGWKTKEENWVKAPWNLEVLNNDLKLYKSLGIKGITSVTCWTSQDYVDRFGGPPIMEYGKQLLTY